MRLTRTARVDVLRPVPILSGLSRRDLERLVGRARELELPEGRTVVREGDRGRELYVLVDGRAKVAKKGRRVATLHPGDFFGEIALVTRVPRTTTVTTETPVRVLVLTHGDFHRLLREQPAIGRKMLESLARRLSPETR